MTGVPQANNLRAVRTVLTAVSIGLGDAETIARALGVSYRQANYYIDAAVGLGLIEREKRGQRYQRTALGQRINRHSAYRAHREIAELAADTAVQRALRSGHADLIALIEGAGYTGATVARRASAAYAVAADIQEILKPRTHLSA